MWEAPLYTTTTSINEINPINTFSIFPNPSKGKYFIDLDLKEAMDVQIIVTDMLGQIITNSTYKTHFKRVELDLSNSQNGIYFVSIITAKTRESRKIILNK